MRPYTLGLPPKGVIPLGAQALHASEPFSTDVDYQHLSLIGSPSDPSTGASADRQLFDWVGYPFEMGLDTYLAGTRVPEAVPRYDTNGLHELT